MILYTFTECDLAYRRGLTSWLALQQRQEGVNSISFLDWSVLGRVEPILTNKFGPA